MALSKDDILNAIADMSVMQVVELVQAMEAEVRCVGGSGSSGGTGSGRCCGSPAAKRRPSST